MIPLMKNAFANEAETKKALAAFISSAGRLSMDEQCASFEKKFAAYQCCSHAILFNSGGSANLAILQTLMNLGRLSRGDHVAFSALTWSTNVMPIIQLGMIPVPVDCNPETLNVMSLDVERVLRRYPIKALFITNALGFCGDLPNIKNLCDSENIILIEDNCECLGTKIAGKLTGNYGLMSSFSFFVAHHMSTIEGGMVCTVDSDCAEMLKIVRANGWDRNLDNRQQHKWRNRYSITSEFIAKYTFYDLGYNLRPTEITGFLGNYQLQFLDDTVQAREANYKRLARTAKDNHELQPYKLDHLERISNFAFPVLCKTAELREKYVYQFAGAGIEIRPMIAGNIKNQPFYKKYVKISDIDLPGAEYIDRCGFYCGNYPELTETELQLIESCLTSY